MTKPQLTNINVVLNYFFLLGFDNHYFLFNDQTYIINLESTFRIYVGLKSHLVDVLMPHPTLACMVELQSII